MKKPLVALLSGAGVSTDSGIPDYRGPNGLWRTDPEAEKLVTYEYYMGDPEIRRRSWRMRRDNRTLNARPNAAHLAVAELERSGVPVRVITQNVDGLHQLAGMPARKVVELHGTARSVVCTACHARTPMEDALARVDAGEDDPPCLACGGVLKSATVMFGERLDPADHRERRAHPVRRAGRRGRPGADRHRAAGTAAQGRRRGRLSGRTGRGPGRRAGPSVAG